MRYCKLLLSSRSFSLAIVLLHVVYLSTPLNGAQVVTGVSVISTSNEFATRVGANTVNESGLSGGVHGTDANTMWLASQGAGTPSITYDLGANYDLSGLHVWNYFESGLTSRGFDQLTISIDSDPGGSSFQSQGTFNFPEETTGQGSAIALNTANTRLVKFDLLSTHGSATWAGLSEVQFTAVPEPHHFGLVGATALGVVAYYRRRYRKITSPLA